MNARAEQVANEVQRELADLIRNEMRDPRVGYVTITRVDISDDLSLARVFVSELSTEAGKSGDSVEALRKAAGFLRRELGKRVRLRLTPELRFEADRSIEEGLRMTQLLDEIARKDTKRDDDESDDGRT
jgi:ribosome-binding factor A